MKQALGGLYENFENSDFDKLEFNSDFMSEFEM